MVLPPVAVVAVFIGFPIVAAIAYTLGRAGGPNSVVASLGQRQFIVHHGVTLDAYRDILGNKTIHRDLWATIWVTIVSTLVVVVISWAIALYLRLANTRLARIVSALSVVPLFIPVVIASYAILTFYASDGFMRTVQKSMAPSRARSPTQSQRCGGTKIRKPTAVTASATESQSASCHGNHISHVYPLPIRQ